MITYDIIVIYIIRPENGRSNLTLKETIKDFHKWYIFKSVDENKIYYGNWRCFSCQTVS